jgi:hypothetical protein
MMPRRKKPGDLAYGYLLQYKKQGDHLLSHLRCWREKKDGLPPEWYQLKQNPQIVRGRLFKSGRMIDSFEGENR